MYIKGMTIGGIPPFTELVEFEFDKRVNVFIGPNTAGKTSVLREMHVPDKASLKATGNRQILRIANQDDEQNGVFQLEFSDDWPGQETDTIESLKEELDESLRLVWERLHFWTRGREVPWIYVPAIRQHLPLSIDAERMHDLAAKLQGPDTLSEILAEDTRYVFDCSTVLRLNHAYHEGFRSRLYSAEEIIKFEGAKELAWKCSTDICREIIDGGDLPNDYVHMLRSEGMSMPVAFYNMQIQQKRHGQSRIFAGDLSAGTQGTIMWLWYVAIKIAHFYDFQDKWSDNPAVLLIDELENQLHPAWQRRVIPALLKHFPGLQIFATTHSPFVVAGRETGQVHKMHVDQFGVIKVSSNAHNYVGWTVEEVLRESMGIGDPTDDRTAEAAAILRWLRFEKPSDEPWQRWREHKLAELNGSDTLTDDQAIAASWLEHLETEHEMALEVWAHEMDKLRSTISHNLESGGPDEAQRELFMAQLAELLDEEEQ